MGIFGMFGAIDIARYFLWLGEAQRELGELISNLKLQKLLYYAQGYYLAVYGEPLFNDQFVAWRHGPVIPELYRKYKKHGDGHIEPSRSYNPEMYPDSIKEFLDDIYNEYGQYSAWKLRNMTHEESPWLHNYDETDNHIIPPQQLSDFFKKRLTEGGNTFYNKMLAKNINIFSKDQDLDANLFFESYKEYIVESSLIEDY